MQKQAEQTPIDYLIVDSCSDRLLSIETILGDNRQHKITGVGDAKTARDILFAQKVKFLIAADHMPRMTGLELVHITRQIPYYLNLPVLILQDNDDKSQKTRTLEEGADHVHVGPLTRLSLQTAIAVTRKQYQNQTQTQILLKEARSLYLQKNYDQAVAKIQSIENISNNTEAQYLLCDCYYRLKNFDKALRYLKTLITAPTSRTMHLFGKICLADGRCGDAISHLTNAILRYPTDLDLKITLGRLYLSLGMDDLASAQFVAVQQGGPSDINLIKMGDAYLSQGMLEKAGEFFNAIEQPIPETAKHFARYAKALKAAGDFKAASVQYEKCLLMQPENQNYLSKIDKLSDLLKDQEENTEPIDNPEMQPLP